MARHCLVSAYALPLWRRSASSADADLAAIAGKAVKEVRYHLDHARSWVVGSATGPTSRTGGAGRGWTRCGRTPSSSSRWTSCPSGSSRGVAADPAALQAVWSSTVEDVLAEATLAVPQTDWRPTGGRSGTHTESFGYLLAEMQHLHRSHPGVTW
jgi:ring-1,2-phenylacetyl-CoA epoxidase subunit PaaC